MRFPARFLIPTLLSLAASLPGLARADVLLSVSHRDGCKMTGVCQKDDSVASATVGSNLAPSQWANGYLPDDPWSKGYGAGNSVRPVFTLGMKAGAALQLTDFRFSLFNNDCQYGAPASCRGANWKLLKVVNGETFADPLLVFNSGGKFADLSFDVKLDQHLEAGDHFGLKPSV